jgi:hypothetical protein
MRQKARKHLIFMDFTRPVGVINPSQGFAFIRGKMRVYSRENGRFRLRVLSISIFHRDRKIGKLTAWDKTVRGSKTSPSPRFISLPPKAFRAVVGGERVSGRSGTKRFGGQSPDRPALNGIFQHLAADVRPHFGRERCRDHGPSTEDCAANSESTESVLPLVEARRTPDDAIHFLRHCGYSYK